MSDIKQKSRTQVLKDRKLYNTLVDVPTDVPTEGYNEALVMALRAEIKKRQSD